MVQVANSKSLAFELSRIALGEIYSEKIVRASAERLEALRKQPDVEYPDPFITKERIERALDACNKALLGVADIGHDLQDASVLMAYADGLNADLVTTRKLSAPIAQDQMYRDQIQGLKEVTASINAALAPEALQACFQPGKLREYAADLDLEFDGRIEVFDDGTLSASLKRGVPGGMTYHVALMLPPNAVQITAQVALSKGDEVLMESEPMRHRDVLHALDAAVESFDQLQAKVPAQEQAAPALSSGLHIGPIVRAEEGRIAQKTGRDPDKLVWHDVSKLQGKVPAVGEHAEISYAMNVGHVKGRERAQELAR